MLAKMYTDPPEELRNFVDTNQELFKYISLHTGAVHLILLLKLNFRNQFTDSVYFLYVEYYECSPGRAAV